MENEKLVQKILSVNHMIPQKIIFAEPPQMKLRISKQVLTYAAMSAYRSELVEEHKKYFEETPKEEILNDFYRAMETIMGENPGMSRAEYASMLSQRFGAEIAFKKDQESKKQLEAELGLEEEHRETQAHNVLARRSFWKEYGRT